MLKTFLELFPEDDGAECHKQNLEVKPPSAVSKVVKVILQAAQHLLHCVRVSVVQSRVTRHSRTDLIEIDISGVVLENLVNIEFTLGTGTDKGHITAEDIPQLWQLVQMVCADELADLCQTRVVISSTMAQLWTEFLGIEAH